MLGREFIFLEITDEEINALLASIQEIVTGVRPTRLAHLTIRGPYDNEIPEEVLEKCRAIMRYDILKIGGVGRFHKPEHVVYLKVDSPNLRDVWWKPDFPIEKYGFNPHISLYRGNDCGLADSLEAFMRSEDITLLCQNFRIVSHVTRQLELMPREVSIDKQFLGLLNTGKVSITFLSRLDKFIKANRNRKLQYPLL